MLAIRSIVRSSATEKTEKSLGQMLIVIMMVGVLMAVFIYYAFKQEATFQSTGFKAIKNTFASKVQIVHAQWLMDNQPNVIVLSSNSSSDDSKYKQIIHLNKKGWIVHQGGTSRCENIWTVIMEMPLALMKETISALEIKDETKSSGSVCRFVIPSGEYFEYNARNGRVSAVLNSK